MALYELSEPDVNNIKAFIEGFQPKNLKHAAGLIQAGASILSALEKPAALDVTPKSIETVEATAGVPQDGATT